METFEQLQGLNKIPLDMTLAGLRSVNQGQQRDDMGLAALAEKNRQEQLMNPLKIQHQQLTNTGQGITNNQGLATLHKQTRENTENDFTSNARMQAELRKHLAEADESDLKLAHYKFQQMAMSQDPKQRKIGETGLGQTKEFILQRIKDKADMDKVNAQGANQLAVARIGAESREAVGRMRGAGGGGKPPKSERELYAYYAKLAADAETPEDAERYTELANVQWQKAIDLAVSRTKEANAGEVDPSKIGKGIPVTPPVGPAPPMPVPPRRGASAPTAGAAPKVVTLDQMKARYPKATEEQIRAAAKAKGIEIK